MRSKQGRSILFGGTRPGTEPEVDTAEKSTIKEVEWFDLNSPDSWEQLAAKDPITSSILMGVRAALGYGAT